MDKCQHEYIYSRTCTECGDSEIITEAQGKRIKMLRDALGKIKVNAKYEACDMACDICCTTLANCFRIAHEALEDTNELD
jgi:hypothetical protein